MKALVDKMKSLKIKEVAGHIAFWCLMLFISFGADVNTDMSFPAHVFKDGLVYGMPLNMLLFYINFLYLVPKLLVQKTRYYIASVILLLLSISVLEGLLDMAYLHYSGTPAKFPGEVTVLTAFGFAIHTLYWFMSLLLRLIRDWFEGYQLQKQIKKEHSKTELALLKSQVHPHFLFNTLNTLYSSSYEFGDMQTAEGIGKLSHLLRYMLYETQDEKVSLENEIDYLRDFIDLQKMRFADDVDIDFSIDFSIDGEPSDIQVAPMLFVTLVENAFKHGISPAKKGHITIKLTITDGKLMLRVENDILRERPSAQLALEGDSGGLGLENLKKRLELLYPDKYLLTTREHNNRYTTELELK